MMCRLKAENIKTPVQVNTMLYSGMTINKSDSDLWWIVYKTKCILHTMQVCHDVVQRKKLWWLWYVVFWKVQMIPVAVVPSDLVLTTITHLHVGLMVLSAVLSTPILVKLFFDILICTPVAVGVFIFHKC